MQDAPAGDPRDEHREAEVDDDVRVLPDAAGPEAARGRREEEAREDEDEVGGEADPEGVKELGTHGLPRGGQVFVSAAAATSGALGRGPATGGRRFEANMSMAMRPTPMQMAMSATLNVGQWWSRPRRKTWTSMKSMTDP